MIHPRGPRLPLVPHTHRTDSKLASIKPTHCINAPIATEIVITWRTDVGVESCRSSRSPAGRACIGCPSHDTGLEPTRGRSLARLRAE